MIVTASVNSKVGIEAAVQILREVDGAAVNPQQFIAAAMAPHLQYADDWFWAD
ncbi:MAG: hypothetical protein GY796_04675 [Chloroflexi bacterium]|nr:hypothetical protein [Chloroflexota bacterium]